MERDHEETLQDIDPATGDIFAEVAISTPESIRDAVHTARKSQRAWAQMPFQERAERLRSGGEELARYAEELAALTTREMGKRYPEAREEARGWAASIPAKIEEAQLALETITLHGASSTTDVVRDPLGVVAAITPWNFPIGMPIELIVPALLVGNTVVFKPSEHVPLVGALIHRCLSHSLPPGVLALIQGRGDVGSILVESDVDMIAFIGSKRAGIDIMSRASRGLKRLLLELGGKDPLIVFADADLEAAAEVAVRESLRNTGQICNSIERIYVESGVAAAFEALVVEKARAWEYGDGRRHDAKMGPLVSAEQRAKVHRHVIDAVARGAHLRLGGRIPEGSGYFYPATLLTDVPSEAELAREETFGPVICIGRFSGEEEEAIELANASEYGLCASVFSGDVERAKRVASRIRCGQVGINRYLGDAQGAPWVGAGQSGIGFLGGVEGVRQFTIPKSLSRPRDVEMVTSRTARISAVAKCEPTSTADFGVGPEPFKIHSVSAIRELSRPERLAVIERASHNVFKIPSEAVFVDLLTDSGTSAMSDRQWGAMFSGDEAYASATGWFRLEEQLKETFGYRYFLPAHQGRGAEKVLFMAMIKPGQTVPNNMHFSPDRVRASGGILANLVIREGKDLQSAHPFKGNMDVGRLEALIREVGRDNVPFIMVTVTCNNVGGQPVSMQNLRDVRKVADRYELPLILDAARIAENAFFIKEREPGYESHSIPNIVREICALSDGCVMSCKKDGLVNIGGFVGINDDALHEVMQSFTLMWEGYVTYGGMAGRDLDALTIGLREVVDERYLQHRIGQVRYLGHLMQREGVPICTPVGGHGVWIDTRRFCPHIDPHQYPGIAITSALYVEGGVRSCELGNLAFSARDDVTGEITALPEVDLVRLAVPRRVYTSRHMEHVASTAGAVYQMREKLSGFRVKRYASMKYRTLFLGELERVA